MDILIGLLTLAQELVIILLDAASHILLFTVSLDPLSLGISLLILSVGIIMFGSTVRRLWAGVTSRTPKASHPIIGGAIILIGVALAKPIGIGVACIGGAAFVVMGADILPSRRDDKNDREEL